MDTKNKIFWLSSTVIGVLLLAASFALFSYQPVSREISLVEQPLGNSALTQGQFFKKSGNSVGLINAANDFFIGGASSSSAPFSINISGDDANLVSSGSLTFGGLVSCDTIDTNASGVLTCGTDGGGGAGVTSNSLNFDEFQNPLVADTDITFTGGAYAFTFDHASVSGNFEVTGNVISSNLVPYTGATTNVDLGGYNLSATLGTFLRDGGAPALIAKSSGAGTSGMLFVQRGSIVDLELIGNATPDAYGFNSLQGDAIITNNSSTKGIHFVINGSNHQLGITNTGVGINEGSPETDFEVVGVASVSSNLYIGGNVGIGTTSPTTKLDVIGNASVSGNFEVTGMTYGNLTGAVTGNASTATALAANGANCNAGEYPLGVNASGAVESCTAIGSASGADTDIAFVTIGNTSSLSFERALTGTANQLTVTDDGAGTTVTLSIPTAFIMPGTASVTTNFEALGFASASQYKGGGLVDCDSAGSQLLWSDTGIFSCQTLADADIPDNITITNLSGTNTGDVSLAGTPNYLTLANQVLTLTKLDISDDTNATGGTGITLSTNDFSFDCSEVEGTGINCTGEAITLDTTGLALLTGATFTGDLFGTNASLSGVFEMGTGFRVTAGIVTGVTSFTSGNNILTNASISGNFDMAAGTKFTGAGLADCDTSTKVLRWDVTTELFSCGTLADADIPDNLTLGTITGTIDAGGATSFEIPNGANPTVDAEGEVAVDSSGPGQFVMYASGSVQTLSGEYAISGSWSSTSAPFTNIASRSIIDYLFRGITIKRIQCRSKNATSFALKLGDGTNDTESITCATTNTFDDGSITNATLTKGEKLEAEVTARTGEVDIGYFTITYVKTRE